MPKAVKVVRGTTGTGSTTDITSSGVGTINGAIILLNVATADDTDTSHQRQCIVLWDGTNCWSLVTASTNGISTAATSSGLLSAVVLDTYSGEIARGTLSNITDGVRISWSNTPDASYKYTAVLFYGGHSIKVGQMQISASQNGVATYSGASFTATAGIMLSASTTASDTDDVENICSIGIFSNKGGTIKQRAYCASDLDGYSDCSINTTIRNDRVFAHTWSGGS